MAKKSFWEATLGVTTELTLFFAFWMSSGVTLL
jgi:hypothetical protein